MVESGIAYTQSTTVRLGNRTYRGVLVCKYFKISPYISILS